MGMDIWVYGYNYDVWVFGCMAIWMFQYYMDALDILNIIMM